jgi:hypothetical protein
MPRTKLLATLSPPSVTRHSDLRVQAPLLLFELVLPAAESAAALFNKLMRVIIYTMAVLQVASVDTSLAVTPVIPGHPVISECTAHCCFLHHQTAPQDNAPHSKNDTVEIQEHRPRFRQSRVLHKLCLPAHRFGYAMAA